MTIQWNSKLHIALLVKPVGDIFSVFDGDGKRKRMEWDVLCAEDREKRMFWSGTGMDCR